MRRDTSQLSKIPYDLLVVGGGINGAAVANIASENGLRVALVDKGDFACGTSSKSTKLIHGGLRYLENFEFGLVKESLRERAVQLASAPHLVKPLAFVIPVYRNDRRPLWMMKLGVSLYDIFSGKYVINSGRSLSVGEVLHFIPDVEKENLVGGVIYWDAQMDDARLVLENVLNARHQGAHIANYVEVRSFLKENGKAVGVKAKDLLTGDMFDIQAKKIICAVGPWTNIFQQKEKSQSPAKVRTTKGIHIVYRRKFSEHAVFIQSQSDKRIFFVIPWYGNTLIGTTDTDYKEHPDDVSVTKEDIDYLLDEASRVFPRERFSDDKIITTFAGLRPLVHKPGAAPGKVSRKHLIEESFSGVQYIVGGKYTTYRVIAEHSLQGLLKTKPTKKKEPTISLYGGGGLDRSMEELHQSYKLDPDVIQFLAETYGSKVEEVLKLTLGDKSLKERIHKDSPIIKAQIKYAVDVEMAETEDDVIHRRLPIAYTGFDLPEIRQYVQEILQDRVSRI